ncbi:hypothetical protein GOP47_0027325 [Adiantum capillus-veneris]|nr:hypothetical protein GOP47_0027325 [Adiantum capillus-veneris]
MSTTDCAPDCFHIILDVYGVRMGSLDVVEKYPNASFVWGRSTLCHELRVYNSETDCWVSFPQSSATQADPSDMNDAFCAEYLDFEHRKSTLHVWNLRKWMKVHVMFAEEAPVSDTTCKKKEGKCAYRWDINTFKAVKCEGHVFLASPMVEESRNIMGVCCAFGKFTSKFQAVSYELPVKHGEEMDSWSATAKGPGLCSSIDDK